MKVMVSDMGGVLYSYDKTLNADKHLENFNKVMGDLYKGGSPTNEISEVEWRAVNDGRLKIYPVKRGVENMLANLGNYQLVIVSNSFVKTSELILDKVGLRNRARKIFDVAEFGNKKDPEMWKKIFRQLPRVDVIIEDGEKNLAAAIQAAKELGMTPETYKEVPVISVSES